MTDTTTAVLILVRILVLVLGVLITYYSFAAYRLTRTPYMRNATIGFSIITLGVFLEGLLYEFGGLNLSVVHIIESVAIGVGFAVLLHSLRQ